MGFLTRLFGFHAPLQPILEAQEPYAPELAPTPPRAELLALDLERLGVDPATVARCEDLPDPCDAAEAMGVLYVIEGSALGGAVLARMASRTLGLTADTGSAYLSGDASLGPRWKLVVAAIERVGEAHGHEGIIRSAGETFDRMEAWLCRP